MSISHAARRLSDKTPASATRRNPMTALTLDLPPDLYARLRAEAERQGRPLEGVAREWLAERLAPPTAALPVEETYPPRDRERSIEAMRAAGLVAEPSPALRARR
jgi:plasmid stability protein